MCVRAMLFNQAMWDGWEHYVASPSMLRQRHPISYGTDQSIQCCRRHIRFCWWMERAQTIPVANIGRPHCVISLLSLSLCVTCYRTQRVRKKSLLLPFTSWAGWVQMGLHAEVKRIHVCVWGRVGVWFAIMKWRYNTFSALCYRKQRRAYNKWRLLMTSTQIHITQFIRSHILPFMSFLMIAVSRRRCHHRHRSFAKVFNTKLLRLEI